MPSTKVVLAGSTRRRGRRRSRGGRGGARLAFPADRRRLHERTEDEHTKTREGGGRRGDDLQEVQAQGEQKSTDRRGDDANDVVDEVVRDAKDDNEHEDGRNEGRVQLAGRELGPAAEEPIDRRPRQEADEERKGHLHEFREQDAPDDRADDREDEPGEVAPERDAEQEADDAPEQGPDEGHHGGPQTVPPECEGEARQDQDRSKKVADLG